MCVGVAVFINNPQFNTLSCTLAPGAFRLLYEA